VATGLIKRLVQKRGYGFIQPLDADEEILFYRSGVEGDAFDQLQVGQQVEFDQEPDPREPGRHRAIHVLMWQA
jgi:CspA family cold shock protein